jgi:hypothetical protein
MDEELILERLEKLSLEDNDVLIFTGDFMRQHEFLSRLRALLNGHWNNIVVVCIAEGMSVMNLDQNEMKRAGWIRRSRWDILKEKVIKAFWMRRG